MLGEPAVNTDSIICKLCYPESYTESLQTSAYCLPHKVVQIKEGKNVKIPDRAWHLVGAH